MRCSVLAVGLLLVAGCVSYQDNPPAKPCGGCSTGERCCLDEDVCWPEGQACPCQGVQCDQPPAPVCQDEFTLRVYDGPGQCQAAGQCRYPFEDLRCETGVCLAGACQGGCGGGGCVSDAECDDGNPCTVEVCQGACCYSDPQPDGLACDDGDECTAGDACQAGVCRGLPVPGCRPCREDADCDDGDVCTADRCENQGCVHELLLGAACDDGDACTLGDRCLAGVCQGTSLVDLPGILPSYSLASTCQGLGTLPEVWFHRVERCTMGLFYNDGWFEGGDVCTLQEAQGGLSLSCPDVGLECRIPVDLDPRAFSADCGGCALSFTADQGCYRNADCPAGRSCQVFLGSDPLGGLEQECQFGAGPGYDNTGASCSSDSQCFSIWCLADLGICNGLCVTDADCQAVDPAFFCADVLLDLGNGVEDLLRRCVPAP
jgi:hypothetical protein